MNTKIFDDVLSNDLLNFIRREMELMRWEKGRSNQGIDSFFNCTTTSYLSHNFLFKLFLQKYSLPYKLLRSYVNCYPPGIEGEFHCDDGDYTFLFYPDEVEKDKGSTVFKDGTKIEYKTNRLLIFNARLLHKAAKNLSNEMRHTIAWKTLK
tara:strand:+ start:1522 stop:1974 length:453 start_codon:yes stop_codon:yes gene_type:complete